MMNKYGNIHKEERILNHLHSEEKKELVPSTKNWPPSISSCNLHGKMRIFSHFGTLKFGVDLVISWEKAFSTSLRHSRLQLRHLNRMF